MMNYLYSRINSIGDSAVPRTACFIFTAW